MGRPIYSYELGDPDFFWLVSSFQENYPGYSLFETGCLPLVFIGNSETVVEEEHTEEGEGTEEVALTKKDTDLNHPGVTKND